MIGSIFLVCYAVLDCAVISFSTKLDDFSTFLFENDFAVHSKSHVKDFFLGGGGEAVKELSKKGEFVFILLRIRNRTLLPELRFDFKYIHLYGSDTNCTCTRLQNSSSVH